MWRSYYDIPKAVFYLLNGDYNLKYFNQKQTTHGCRGGRGRAGRGGGGGGGGGGGVGGGGGGGRRGAAGGEELGGGTTKTPTVLKPETP